jgi:hypothetical protein
MQQKVQINLFLNLNTFLQSQAARAGIVHCKHNVVNDFDYRSDIAQWHQIRHVPSFLVFTDGSLIDRIILPDSRGRAYGPSNRVRI